MTAPVVVLVIESCPALLKSLLIGTRVWGYEARPASSAEEVATFLASQTPAAILVGPSLAEAPIPALESFADITLTFRPLPSSSAEARTRRSGDVSAAIQRFIERLREQNA